MSKKIYRIDTTQIFPFKPRIKVLDLKDVIKELNKVQSTYKYCINKKDISLIIKKETNKTLPKYGDMLLGFGKKVKRNEKSKNKRL